MPQRAIAASALSKSFRLPHERYASVRERVVHPFAKRSYTGLQALRDVSFEVRPGECFGVLGKNGSGKSTLLKCLAGIYRLDGGEVTVDGRMAAFIELGVGFNLEMTAHDNAVLNAIMLGLPAREARERFDEIVEFAELQDFVDLKLKNYSSGMLMRLAFAVTVQVDADVVVCDEVLAVGDAAFQEKCLAQLERLRDAGRTVVLVTHDMDTVRRVCDRALLLHRGELVSVGEGAAVADAYEELNRRDRAPLRVSHARGVPPAPRERRAARRRELREKPTDLRRVAVLSWHLAVAEFKLRYLDSALSYLWAVARPLAYFGVLYAFVTQVTGLDNGIRHYPAYLFAAIMLWTFFDQSASGAVHSLVHNESVLRKVPIPRSTIPLAVVMSAFFDLCMNLIAVIVVVLASGIVPGFRWLEMPLLVALVAALAAGVVLLVSALYVRFRDVDQIWIVATQALFFGTPIFYVVATLPDSLRQVAMASPLAAIFTEMRHALIDPGAPSAAAAAGGAVRLLIPLAVGLATVGLGMWVFRRESPWVAENL